MLERKPVQTLLKGLLLLPIICLFLSFNTAQAGQLFPPYLDGSNDPIASTKDMPCPSNTVMRWNPTKGFIYCGDASPTVSTLSPANGKKPYTCPKGTAITSINNGVPTCGTLNPFGKPVYKCPVLSDMTKAGKGGTKECTSHCSGQYTDRPTCTYYWDNDKSAGWACYGKTVAACKLVLP